VRTVSGLYVLLQPELWNRIKLEHDGLLQVLCVLSLSPSIFFRLSRRLYGSVGTKGKTGSLRHTKGSSFTFLCWYYDSYQLPAHSRAREFRSWKPTEASPCDVLVVAVQGQCTRWDQCRTSSPSCHWPLCPQISSLNLLRYSIHPAPFFDPFLNQMPCCRMTANMPPGRSWEACFSIMFLVPLLPHGKCTKSPFSVALQGQIPNCLLVWFLIIVECCVLRTSTRMQGTGVTRSTNLLT